MEPSGKPHAGDKIIVSIDPDFKDIVPGFLDHRREDIRKILNAIEKNDFESIRVIGHSMKGAGGGYGFDAISDIGRSIETGAMDSKPEDIRRSLEKLAAYLDNVEIVYE